VRVALKKLRYALELDVEARQLPLTGDLTILKASQDVLGHLHDLEGLIECSRQVQVSLLPDDLRTSRELKLFVRAVEEQCRNLHGQFMRDPSGLIAITRRNETKGSRPLPAVRRAVG
jgi:CHAD domain-containing protein